MVYLTIHVIHALVTYVILAFFNLFVQLAAFRKPDFAHINIAASSLLFALLDVIITFSILYVTIYPMLWVLAEYVILGLAIYFFIITLPVMLSRALYFKLLKQDGVKLFNKSNRKDYFITVAVTSLPAPCFVVAVFGVYWLWNRIT